MLYSHFPNISLKRSMETFQRYSKYVANTLLKRSKGNVFRYHTRNLPEIFRKRFVFTGKLDYLNAYKIWNHMVRLKYPRYLLISIFFRNTSLAACRGGGAQCRITIFEMHCISISVICKVAFLYAYDSPCLLGLLR